MPLLERVSLRDPPSRLNNIDTGENKGHEDRKADANRLIDSHGSAHNINAPAGRLDGQMTAASGQEHEFSQRFITRSWFKVPEHV